MQRYWQMPPFTTFSSPVIGTADQRVPTPAELAFEIFFNLLIENNQLGHIAWDAGGDEALEGYDRLFSTAGLAKFTDGECEEAANICTRCRKRGDPLLMLFDHLHAAAKTRGREIVHSNMGKATNSRRYSIITVSVTFCRGRAGNAVGPLPGAEQVFDRPRWHHI